MQLYIYYINCPILSYRVVSLNNCKSIFLSSDGVHEKYQLHQASFPIEILAPLSTPSKALMISLIIRSAIVLGIIVVYWYSSRQLTKKLPLQNYFRHRCTRRYEAHLWYNSCRREKQTCKGRQCCYFKYVYFFYKFNLSTILLSIY